MSMFSVKRGLLAASLALSGLFGAVSATQAAVVVSFDPAYGDAIPNLGFKGTATLDVSDGCATLGGGYFYLNSEAAISANCKISVQAAHIDFYNTTLGSNSVFSSLDLTPPYPDDKLTVTQAYFDLETQELAGISTTDSTIFSLNLLDEQPNSANNVQFQGFMVLYFDTGYFGEGKLATTATTTPGVGGAFLSTCRQTDTEYDACSHVTTSNSATTTFTNQPVPEPGSLALVGAALAGLGFARRRRAAR